MSKSLSSNWFVAQYKPNSFLLAKRNLEKQGVITFLPLIDITRRSSSRFFTDAKPLFPGYIFVSFNLGSFKWTSINYTIGLNKLIMKNNIPQNVPEQFINSLKLRCDDTGKIMKGNMVKIGKKVEVLQGPFAKMVGSVEKIDPEERITLLFQILGQQTKTIISNKDIKLLN